jgi:hypothetical protein
LQILDGAEPAPPPPPPAQGPQGALTASSDAVEVDRVVPASGNLQLDGQQLWFGPQRAGARVRLWIDTTTVHVSVDGRHLKTLPSRLSTRDLARLRADGARPAGPPPPRPAAHGNTPAACPARRRTSIVIDAAAT